jgi:hypothetical protein
MFPATTVRRPDAFKMAPKSAVVVVFPFVPVMAADRTGHRPAKDNARYPNSNSPHTGTPAPAPEPTETEGTPGLAITRSQERDRK